MIANLFLAVSLGMMAISALALGVLEYLIRRNRWVYAEKMRVLFDRGPWVYERMAGYDEMLYRRWWCWDVNAFLAQRDRVIDTNWTEDE